MVILDTKTKACKNGDEGFFYSAPIINGTSSSKWIYALHTDSMNFDQCLMNVKTKPNPILGLGTINPDSLIIFVLLPFGITTNT